MNTRTMIRIGATLMALAFSSSLCAQTPWNRKVEGISILPDPSSGRSAIRVYYSLLGGDTPTAPQDYATDILVMVNGVLRDQQRIPLVVGPGGETSGCAGIGCLTHQACICCNIGGDVVCLCGGWIAPSEPWHATLEPEDIIEVLLRPAPGAVPERDTSDDAHFQVFRDRDVFWNRRLDPGSIAPSPGGQGREFDVFFDIDVETNYDGNLNLAADVEVLVNGTSHGTFPTGFPENLASNQCGDCGIYCAYFDSGDPAGICDTIGGNNCGCTVDDIIGRGVIRAVPAEPGDVIEVILRPAPGALPELPGFGDDEESSRCIGDLDGDGLIAFGDILKILAAWGPCAGCPEDLNGNDVVEFGDLLLVLGLWGPCAPM